MGLLERRILQAAYCNYAIILYHSPVADVQRIYT